MAFILHIDDDANDRELTSFRLGRLLSDSSITSVSSGAKGIEALESNKFDCIICDFQMPGLNGLDVLRLVRSKFGNIPFIFLTGQGNEDVAADALRSGANDYFTKGEGLLHFERLANSILHHITTHELKKRQHVAQARIEHLNLVLQAIRGVNRIITKATSAEPMLEDACAQLVETRGYRYGWIALFDENREVTKWTLATANGESDDLYKRLYAGLFTDLIYKASKRGGVLIENDFACVDKKNVEWCAGGPCNVMLRRLAIRDSILGVMCVALPEDINVDEEETILFSELADDLALALDSFEHARKRRHAEQALQETKANLQSVIAAAPGAIGLVADRNFLWVSQRMEDMLGYTSEELIGKNARILYESDEEYLNVGKAKYSKIAETGIGSTITRWVKKDGSILDIFLQSAPIDRNDLSLGVTFVGTDITETKLAMERAHLHESALKAVLEALPAFVHIHSKDYKINYANEEFIRLFGNPNGHKCFELLGRRDDPCEECNTADIFKSNKQTVWQWQGPNGRQYLVYGIPFTSESGETEILEIGFDIEEGVSKIHLPVVS